uniref:Major facilitator superfamily (MFS) profile domain-containing protein n=1 Tax=Amphimedon queenslandica TaxID=400682 RepID=A0A1X7TK36_AMPQE
MIVPVYNAELAPKTLRGRLVSLNQLFITAGIMVSFCVSVAVHTVDFGWRIALGLQCVLAVVLIIGMIFLPETPRCCCPWSNACRVRTAQEEDTVAIVGIKNENKDDTSDEAEDE